MEQDKLNLIVELKKHLEMNTNDILVKLRLSSITGYYQVFRVNINLHLHDPKTECSELFNQISEQMTKSTRHVSIYRNKSSNKKRTKNMPIYNHLGQAIGVKKVEIDDSEQINSPKNNDQNNPKRSKSTKTKDNFNLFKKSKNDKPINRFKKDSGINLEHNIFDPNFEGSKDLYNTKSQNNGPVSMNKNPILSNHINKSKLDKNRKSILFIKNEEELKKYRNIFNKQNKITVNLEKKDLDKADNQIPFDFELEMNFDCANENVLKWEQKWIEIEKSRIYIVKKLNQDESLGNYMLNGY